jgi:hypothetical protein
VVGFNDYVIRPRLVGDEDMPLLLTFIALFGCLEALGVSGLLVGPLLVPVALVALRIYDREARDVGSGRVLSPGYRAVAGAESARPDRRLSGQEFDGPAELAIELSSERR